MFKKFILPSSLLMASIIGAGIFALPYVFQKAGIIVGLFYLIIFAAVFALIHLMYGDVIIKTGERHRFVGYANKYLGVGGRWLAVLTSIIGTLFILTVYLILAISFIKLLWPAGPETYKILIFWIIASAAIF